MNAVDNSPTDDQSQSRGTAELPAYTPMNGIGLGIIAIAAMVILCMMAAFWGQIYMLRNPQAASVYEDTSALEEAEDYLQSRPEPPLPVDESAKDELMSGIYEAPSPWLHNDYAQGVNEWKVAGKYMGVSADKSVVVFDESGEYSEDYSLVGRDIHTGKEKWHLEYGDGRGQCSRPVDGIAYCSRLIDMKLFAIDYGTGKLAPVGEINNAIAGLSPKFVAAQSGQTVWTVESAGLDAERITDLIAIKEGVIQWRTPIRVGSECQPADGVVVCEAREAAIVRSLEIFSTVSGKKVSEYEGLAEYRLFRDGLVIQTQDGGHYKYSWTGEKIGPLPFEVTALNVWPQHQERRRDQSTVLPPLRSVDHLQGVRAVNSVGEPLIREEKNAAHEDSQLVDISTGNTVAGKARALNIWANEKGTLYLTEDRLTRETILYGEDGTEIFRRARLGKEYTYCPDGIFYSETDTSNIKEDITVYAPKGQ